MVKLTRTATTQINAARLDAVDEMMETLKGTHVNEVNVDEIEDSDDDTMGRGDRPPTPYVQLSSRFGSLESAAEACGNGEASLYLQKARMSFIKVHASKPTQQADMRQFCEPELGQGGGAQRKTVVHCTVVSTVVRYGSTGWSSVVSA